MESLIHHLLAASARRFPDKEAVADAHERLTYRTLERRVAGAAAGLVEAGLRRGDRVGIYLDHSVAQVIAIFAVARAGGVFVPIHRLLFPDQVEHIARDSGMRGLITAAPLLSLLAPALRSVASLELLVTLGAADADVGSRSVHAFERFCEHAPPAREPEVISHDLAALLYTSGSTGKPKGVMVTHRNVLAGSSIVSAYLGITETDRILSILPLSFDAGLNQLMTAVHQGGTLVMMSFTVAQEIAEKLRAERITGLAGVPMLWSLIAQLGSSLGSEPLPHLRYITNTGGKMPQPVLAALRRALPTTRIFLMYGLTEAFRSTYLPPEELDRRPESIGRAIPDTEILVLDEDGRPCGPGEVGELVHRGPTVSLGYWNQPELTAQVLRRHPHLPPELASKERVCYSGDLVKKDEEGFLFFVGRRDALIKSSGYRISPTEVEELLFRTGKIVHAAVIGVPDELTGQAIRAFVVLRAGVTVTPEELLRLCVALAPRYLIPRDLEILEALPRTSSGKVDYPSLRRRAGLS